MGIFDFKKSMLSMCLSILGILTLVTGLIFLIVSIPSKKEIVTTIYKYNIQRNAVPLFKLKEDTNYYYDYLTPSTGVYPASAVESMSLALSYVFEGDDYAQMDYSYSIDARIIGDYPTDRGTSTIWEKKYVLLDEVKNKEVNKTRFAINEKVSIDFQYYNALVKEYKNTFQLAINAYLKVRLNVSYSSMYETGTVSNKDFVEVNIPLNDTFFDVRKNFSDYSTDSVTNVEKIPFDYVTVYAGLVLIIIAIILFITASNKREVTKYSKYKKNIDRVLKEYGDLIVTVTNKPNIKNLQVMGLATIDDLVDVADQNKCHIIRYEILKKCESFLLVIQGTYVYVYVVTDEELKFAK